jgi:predicted dehydrogenase
LQVAIAAPTRTARHATARSPYPFAKGHNPATRNTLTGRSPIGQDRPQAAAVIDVSHWHSTYDAAYLRVLTDLGVPIAGVSDRDPAIAEDRARRFNSRAFTDYREMLDAVRPDFVIALGRHVDMPETARHLIAAGIPFLMEKPMGVDAETVAALADLAEQRGAWAAVPFPNRQSSWAVKARQMLAAGEFGRLSHIVIRIIRPTMERYRQWDSPWMWERAAAGGGALTNLGGHGFDLAHHLLGDELRVESAVISNTLHNAEVEDYALVTLSGPRGVLVHIEVGYTMPTWPANRSDNEFKIAGEKALLRAEPDGLRVLGPDRDEFIANDPSVATGYPAYVADCLARLARGDRPAVTPRDCAHAVALIHEAYSHGGPLSD